MRKSTGPYSSINYGTLTTGSNQTVAINPKNYQSHHYQSTQTLKTQSQVTSSSQQSSKNHHGGESRSEKAVTKKQGKTGKVKTQNEGSLMLSPPNNYLQNYGEGGSQGAPDSSINLSEYTESNQYGEMIKNNNKENVKLFQAHYQQYLQHQQQVHQLQMSTGSQYYQLQQKNSLNSNNFHSSDMSLSQSSQSDLSRASKSSKRDPTKQFKGSGSINSGSASLGESKNGFVQAQGTPSFFKNIINRKPLNQVYSLPQQNNQVVEINDPMLIPNDQNMSPISSSSYEGLQSISNISNNMSQSVIIHQDAGRNIQQHIQQDDDSDSNQNTLHHLQRGEGGPGSLDLSQSTTSNNYPQHHLQQLTSIHKHLRFDSLQSSSTSSIILNDAPVGVLNNYCDFIPALASPQLSSSAASIIGRGHCENEGDGINSGGMLSPRSYYIPQHQQQQQQQQKQQNTGKKYSSSQEQTGSTNLDQHYQNYIMAQKQMRSEHYQQQQFQSEHDRWAPLSNQHIVEFRQGGLALNNSLLDCMDQFNECGPAGIDSAKHNNYFSGSTCQNQQENSGERSSPQPPYDDASVIVAATQIQQEEEEGYDMHKKPNDSSRISRRNQDQEVNSTSSLYTSSANGSYPVKTPQTTSYVNESSVAHYEQIMDDEVNQSQNSQQQMIYEIKTLQSSRAASQSENQTQQSQSKAAGQTVIRTSTMQMPQHQTQKQQLVEILDAGDTPSMELSSNNISIISKQQKETSPELLGTKESRRRQQLRGGEDYLRESAPLQSSLSQQSRNLKASSVKSCNIVLPVNKPDQMNQQTLSKQQSEICEGTAALYGLINKSLNNAQSKQESRHETFSQMERSQILQKSQEIVSGKKPFHFSDLVSPDQHNQLLPQASATFQQLNFLSPSQGLLESKVSSMIESPMPPVTDPKTHAYQQKVGVMNFSGKYLERGGMMPSKQPNSHLVSEYNTVAHQPRQSIDLSIIRQSVSSLQRRPGVQVLSSNYMDLKTARGGGTEDQLEQLETRIKPFKNDGALTERATSVLQKPMQHKHSFSISRTIDLVPLTLGQGNSSVSQSQTNLYPAHGYPDMSIVQKINSTLDNNYYQGRNTQQHLLRSSTSSNNSQSVLSSSNNGQALKKPSDHQGLGFSQIPQLLQHQSKSSLITNEGVNTRVQSQSFHHAGRHHKPTQSLTTNLMGDKNIQSSRNVLGGGGGSGGFTQQTLQHQCDPTMLTTSATSMMGPMMMMTTVQAYHQHQPTQVQYPMLTTTLDNFNFMPGSPQNEGLHRTNTICSNNNNPGCKECLFEREKRNVTQKAFERALNISMYLMEEIEKLNYYQAGTYQGIDISRQDILNLLKSNQGSSEQFIHNLPVSSGLTTNYNSNHQQQQQHQHHLSNRFFTRSKSQNMMNSSDISAATTTIPSTNYLLQQQQHYQQQQPNSSTFHHQANTSSGSISTTLNHQTGNQTMIVQQQTAAAAVNSINPIKIGQEKGNKKSNSPTVIGNGLLQRNKNSNMTQMVTSSFQGNKKKNLF